MASRSVPAPGEAALTAANAAALLRTNGTDADRAGRAAIRFEDRVWTHGEYLAESIRWANLFLAHRRDGQPFHVGVLLDNLPEYLFALGGAGLVGATVVGLNHTRQGEHLARDLEHTHVGLVVTEPRHRAALPDGLDDVLVVGEDLEPALAEHDGAPDPGVEPDLDDRWALIFTSGTSAAPKAVICTQRRLLVTGNRMGMIMGIGPDDIGYVSMPLFHSSAVMVGWAPSIVHGASVGLARRFSASGWLPDVRHYGATYFNYTGKPVAYVVATPEQPDDADNTLRIGFGNEGSPEVVETFARRFGVEVIDAFGATEGGIAVDRDAPRRPGSLGRAGEDVRVVDEDGNDLPAARFDDHGQLLNADECVGEMVNVGGAGPFEGYYNNPEANAATTRNGWYWSGDLGYLDEDRYLYFAGRNADWIRVDGENFPAAPIEAAISRHPAVVEAAVYGVPDDQAGDQVMVAVVLRDGEAFDPVGFACWLDELGDIGPKWRPRYVRVANDLPTTGTNKTVKRTLVRQKFRGDLVDGDDVWIRERGDDAYRPFDRDEEAALRDRFVQAGREQFWEL